MLMKDLIERWIAKQQNRVELGKLKPASLDTFTSRVSTHILPHLGDLEIETIRNGVVKQFAETIAQKLGPKTTREVVALVKMILESHVNEDGEPILDLKWRSDFILENVKAIGRQSQPTITREALNVIIRNRTLKVRDRVFIALAASTGLRVGELLALKIGDVSGENTTWSTEGAVIRARKSIYRGQVQDPKTLAAIRDIDLSTPVQNMLIEFAEGLQPGFLFCTKSGKPLEPSHVRKYIMLPNGIQGAHALRRFRITRLEEQSCPRGLLAAWVGHSTADVTAKYDKTAEDQEFRRKQVERVGTGLDVASTIAPQIEKPGTQRGKGIPPALRESRLHDPKAQIVVKHSLVRRSKAARTDIQLEISAPRYVASDDDLPEIFSTPVLVPVAEEVQ